MSNPIEPGHVMTHDQYITIQASPLLETLDRGDWSVAKRLSNCPSDILFDSIKKNHLERIKAQQEAK